MVRTVRATLVLAARLHPVTDDPAFAVTAHRRQRMNCALEAVEDVRLRADRHRERLVVFIAANFSGSHGGSPRVLAAFCARNPRAHGRSSSTYMGPGGLPMGTHP